jgi:hypothetical protein
LKNAPGQKGAVRGCQFDLFQKWTQGSFGRKEALTLNGEPVAGNKMAIQSLTN